MNTFIFDDTVRVYTKNNELLAIFDGNTEGYSEEEMRDVLVCPKISLQQNGSSTFSFQILANSPKWKSVRNIENIWEVNGRRYTALNEGSIKYTGNGSIRIANCEFVELFYLLKYNYHQIYNTGLYCFANAKFQNWDGESAVFKIMSTDCHNPGDTISSKNAWDQIKLWSSKDNDGNYITYTILKDNEHSPTNWANAPSIVSISSISFSGNQMYVKITARAKTEKNQNYEYSNNNTYKIDVNPYPNTIKSVFINSTIVTIQGNKRTYTTSNKTVSYSYSSSSGTFSLKYTPLSNETINYVAANYDYVYIGEISNNATCTIAYGAEAIDEHTILLLPKSDKKYKLTIDGISYDDTQVKDSRGAIMPRGSAGYNMWAILKNTGWTLGICDVIATDFDPSIDYGVFNIESDMKDTLYNIQYIQELYGGILDWDSKNKILNYRAENNNDYQAYDDGFNRWTGYEFREGKNIIDRPSVTEDNNLITKAFIIGNSGLNIKKVNNGKGYLENHSYTDDIYEGYLEQQLIYDTNDDSGMRQLLYWGQKELKKYCAPRKTITINATDIRTVEGYEHEIFNINDIVKVYTRDDIFGEEVVEEKRIILWEYNVFAHWDCIVELGDKTRNFSELFKLIYNSSVKNPPKPNASGQISSDKIVINTETLDNIFGYDYNYNESFSGGSYGGFLSGGNTLTDYINLIVRKTTDNSEAVSGLTIDANELHSKTELFSTYQSTTDNIISNSYAGLTTYADAVGSNVLLSVSGTYATKTSVSEVQTEVRSGFLAQQSINSANTRQFSELYQTTSDLRTKTQSNTSAIAEVNTNVSNINGEIIAQAGMIAEINKTTTSLDGKITTTSNSLAEYKVFVKDNYATAYSLSSYKEAMEKYVNGQWYCRYVLSNSGFYSFASGDKAEAGLFADYKVDTNKRIIQTNARIDAYADENIAMLQLKAAKDDFYSMVTITQNKITLYCPSQKTAQNTYLSISGSDFLVTTSGAASIRTNGSCNIQSISNTLGLYGSTSLSITSGGTIQIGNTSNTVTIKGKTVGYTTIYAYASTASTAPTAYKVFTWS